MRLSSLILESYGPFERQELDFEPAPGRINLLVAPNGAGKSVLRRAFGDLLFGIPERTPMSWQYGTQTMRLHARAVAGGETTALVRRKGRGNTLSDGAGPVAPEALHRLLGSADERLFADLFALDSQLLREGGAELSRASGRLGRMLLAGSGGLGRVQKLLEGLVEARDAIGRAERRHVTQPIWAAAAEATEAARLLSHAALRPEAFLALERVADEAAAALEALRTERVAVEADLARLSAVRAVRPWLARRDGAQAALAGAADVPRLEPGFEARWRHALEAGAAATAAAAATARQAEAADAALAVLSPDSALLEAAGPIEAVLRDAVRALNAEGDLPEVEAACQQARLEAARLRRELGWDGGVAVPAAPAVRAARDRLGARAGLVAAMESAAREQQAAAARLVRARAELDAVPAPVETAPLAAVVKEIRAAGDPARRREDARRALRDAEAELERALARIPDRALTRAQLGATRAPAEAALAACEQALAATEADHRDSVRERDRLAREQAAAQAKLDALSRSAALPAPGALAAARVERDRLWDQVCAGGNAAVAFERALRHADAVADTMLVLAAQVAQADELRRHIATLAEGGAAAQAASVASAGRLQGARDALAALAAAAGAPGEAVPAALRAFLAARGAALDRAVDLDRARAEADAIAAALDAATARLAQALDHPVAEGLAALLEAADTRIGAAREAELARRAAAAELRRAEQEAAERMQSHERAASALAAWTDAWRATAAALARPADETPEATGAALALVDDLREHEAAAAREAARIRDMRASVDGFAARIAALCDRIAPDLAAAPPQDAAARLDRALKQQRQEAAKLQARREDRDRSHAEAAREAESARRAADALAALRAALGVADDEAATQQLDRVRKVAEAAATRDEARRHILAQGGGRTEAALEALAAASTPEADDSDIARLSARQAELGPLIETASADARSAAEARDRAGTGEGAQDAAARREAALAALARHAEEALVLHAAASLLRAGLDAERAASGSQTVARIGAVFSAVTGGAYAGVAVEDDGTDQVLVAVEADRRAHKPVADLSEGTSDQLFLALRIVALEAYVRANPALPFIADDVLQTFDDDRATAALRALLALSAHVQVIVLTHHPHVQALARALPAGTVHTLVLPDLPIASAA